MAQPLATPYTPFLYWTLIRALTQWGEVHSRTQPDASISKLGHEPWLVSGSASGEREFEAELRERDDRHLIKSAAQFPDIDPIDELARIVGETQDQDVSKTNGDSMIWRWAIGVGR